ncbi:MAG: polymer-forming cytoskeletal protein [Candidatus Paceibacterota bacterium]
MKKHIFTLTVIALMLSTQSASALILDAGESVDIKEKVQGDAYLAGQTVRTQETIEGDAIIAGGTVDIDSTITQDAIIAGDKITINQEIGDDIRLAGSTIIIKADVKGDIIAFAETLIIDKDVTIEGDIIAFVSKFQLDGKVNGNINIASVDSTITGTVLGDTKIRTADFNLEGTLTGKTEFVAERVVNIADSARFGNTVNYGHTKELDLNPNLQEGAVANLDPELLKSQTDRQKMLPNMFSGMLVFRILSAALVILIFSWLFGKFTSKATKNLENSKDFRKAFFYGILLFFLPISIIILLFISIIGIPVALFITFAYLSMIFFSQSITSFIIAQWLNHKYDLKQPKIQLILVALGIYIVLYLLKFIPILGSVIGLILTYIAFGTLIIEYKKK